VVRAKRETRCALCGWDVLVHDEIVRIGWAHVECGAAFDTEHVEPVLIEHELIDLDTERRRRRQRREARARGR
jgi:hypothetical protein